MSLEIPREPRREVRPTTSLLGSRHRETLAALRSAAPQDLTAPARLLACAEAMGALPALVVRLVGTLHDGSPGGAVRSGIDTQPVPGSQGNARGPLNPDSCVLRRSSGVHLLAFWSCAPKSASD